MRNPNPSDQSTAISEINVTPLIDVMLCLLIIFMIAIPTMTGRVTLDLPPSGPIGPSRTNPEPPTEINVLADGRIMLDHRPASTELIAAEMAFQIARDKHHMVAIAAEQEAHYDQVLAVIASAKAQGVVRIAMK